MNPTAAAEALEKSEALGPYREWNPVLSVTQRVDLSQY
jgi:hypothetical protein